jgi:CheY-like chemotaxis protein
LALRVLLADDSMIAQNMGKKILTEAGYDVVTVSNGAAAAKKIPEARPDIILLDVYMPGYNGLEVCQQIRSVPETATVPVLLTVGKLEPFSPEDGMRVKADGIIIKPFEATDLIAVVDKLAERVAQPASPDSAVAAAAINLPVATSPAPAPEFSVEMENSADFAAAPPDAHAPGTHAEDGQDFSATRFLEPTRAAWAPSRIAETETNAASSGPAPEVAVNLRVSVNEHPAGVFRAEGEEPALLKREKVSPGSPRPELEIQFSALATKKLVLAREYPSEESGAAEFRMPWDPPLAEPEMPAVATSEGADSAPVQQPAVPLSEACTGLEPFEITLEPLPDAEVDFTPAPGNEPDQGTQVAEAASIIVSTPAEEPQSALETLRPPAEEHSLTAPHVSLAATAQLSEPEAGHLEASVGAALHQEMSELLDSMATATLRDSLASLAVSGAVEAGGAALASEPPNPDLPAEQPQQFEGEASPELELQPPEDLVAEPVKEAAAAVVPDEIFSPEAGQEISEFEPAGETGSAGSVPENNASPQSTALEETLSRSELARECPANAAVSVAAETPAPAGETAKPLSDPGAAFPQDAISEAAVGAPVPAEPLTAEAAQPQALENSTEPRLAGQPPVISPRLQLADQLDSLTELLAEQLADRVLQRLKAPLVQEIRRILSGK